MRQCDKNMKNEQTPKNKNIGLVVSKPKNHI